MKLELRGITKRFGDLVANDHIDLVVQPGEIRGLLGENGAGKTTLMNVLYGLVQPDEGEILLDDSPVSIKSPRDAITAKIGMVHQHFMLVPVFTVAENVTLGTERVRRLGTPPLQVGQLRVPPLRLPSLGLLDRRRTRRDVIELSERFGLRVDPDAYVEDLPVGVQQRVEIIKALLRDASVLVLDEPTAVLTPNETQDLFRIMRELREGGRSIVFISHKLKEVQAIADNVTIIRRGRVVGERPPSTSDSELAALMVGRSVQLRVDKTQAHPRDVVLDVAHLNVHGERGEQSVRDLSFQVRAGEILGVAGVQGNGQTELCEALMGLRPATGSVRLNGAELSRASTRDRLRAGIGYVPEDRQEDGLVGDFSVAENLVLDVYDRPPYASGIALNLAAVRSSAERLVADYDVRTTSTTTRASTLSGGNQQKVIVAREMGREVQLLLASQPTRGLDVGSIEFVHKQVIAQRDRGAAVVIVSSELDEIYALSDRIAVMYEGRIVGYCPPDTPEAELGLMMAGASAEAVAAGQTVTGGPADAAPHEQEPSADESPAARMSAGQFEHAEDVRAALRAIVSDPHYGQDALSNPQTLTNLLQDLLPDAPREAGLLISAAAAGIPTVLADHVAQGMDAQTAIRLTSAVLATRTAFTPDACEWAVTELAVALGIVRDGLLPPKPTPQEQTDGTALVPPVIGEDPPTAQQAPAAHDEEPPAEELTR